MPAIKLVNITKKFATTLVVDNLSLGIEKGSLVGVLGSSGCGKTTLLRLIAGLEEANNGTIEIDGKLANNPKVLIPPQKREVGMVFQDLALWPHLTVQEHLEFVLKTQDIAKNFQFSLRLRSGQAIFNFQINPKFKIKNNKIGELLGLVRLPKCYLNSYPHQLSGGERQRLAIARSLAQNPKILLLDEPLANLDSMLKADLKNEIRRLQQKLEITMVYVTHDAREIKDFAQKLVIMEKGKIVQEGKTEEVLVNPKNEFVYRLIGKEGIE